MRLVAVLGYTARRANGLDAVCLARLRHAETLAADAVFLSGRGGVGEAELMRTAWRGPDVPIVSETAAGTTADNAVEIGVLARRLDADEVVVVTSAWHARRAGLLVRSALRGSGVEVRTSSPDGQAPARLLTREAACMLALPYLLLRSARRGRR